ncbi:hypothetical protein D3C87_1870670 [compost metagenome]
MFQAPFECSGQTVTGRLLDIVSDRRILSLNQALGVQAGPAKAAAHEQALTTDRNLSADQFVAGKPTDIAPITQHLPGLSQPDQTEQAIGQRCNQTNLG